MESARPAKGDCKLRGFEQEGKAVFQGKVKRKKKEQGMVEAKDETENDAPEGSRGLGRRIHGSVEDTKLSTNKQHTLSTKLKEVGVPAGRKDGGSVGMWKPS